ANRIYYVNPNYVRWEYLPFAGLEELMARMKEMNIDDGYGTIPLGMLCKALAESGAADMAFPVLNMLSFWITFVALVVLMLAFCTNFFVDDPNMINVIGPIGGWTGYAPLSALGDKAGPGQGLGVILWIT